MNDIKQQVSKAMQTFCNNHKMTQWDFCKYARDRGLDVTPGTINTWYMGTKAPMRKDYQQKLFEILDLHIENDTTALYNVKYKEFPLLGSIACGEPVFADEHFIAPIKADMNIKADFCLIAKGDSMQPLINDGDIVFVKKQGMVNNGEIAVVLIDDEATLKRVYQDEDILTLIPENKKYKPIISRAEENKDIRICGKAVAYQSMLED